MFRRANQHIRTPRLMTERRSYSSRVLHVTDMEGSKTFFSTIKKSTIVHYHPEKGLQFDKHITRPYFIFGGDATDRGPHDLEITDLLVDFKKRHPMNVFLLAGNREIKNNRLKIELDPRFIRERLLQTQSPRWLPNQKTTPLDYVAADKIPSLSTEDCQLAYLHWMLEKTMGCPHTFRYRREEMAKQSPGKTITDHDVLRNFIRETAPDGLMGQYLQLAQIGVVIPDTGILAIHGGLTETSIGMLPDMPQGGKPIHDLREWVHKFNQWYTQQIKLWMEYEPIPVSGPVQPANTKLDDCVLPVPGKNKSIITSDMLGKEREFKPLPDAVGRYLKENGIMIVLTGHQPSGDYPAILRDDAHHILSVNGDTGYANDGAKNPDDTRGKACHTLEIDAGKNTAELNIVASLVDGKPVSTHMTITSESINGDDYIGKVLADGRLVQCRLADDQYRLAQQNGYKVSYTLISKSELEHLVSNQRKYSG